MEQRPLEAIEAKKAKIEVTLASSEAGQLGQIESEFQFLSSPKSQYGQYFLARYWCSDPTFEDNFF
jgi:hypothetical protein